MDKQTFTHFIKEIEKSHQKWQAASNRIAEDMDSFVNYPTFGLFEIAIEILSEAMNDENKMIDYYIWDLEFGAEGKDCLETKTGKKISLTTSEELYDWLTKN